jgi:hypothetical protein
MYEVCYDCKDVPWDFQFQPLKSNSTSALCSKFWVKKCLNMPVWLSKMVLAQVIVINHLTIVQCNVCEQITCASVHLKSLWKMVLATLKAMSGRMLNKVCPNSWTPGDWMSAPITKGTNPLTHALKFDRMARNSWFRSSCSNLPK